MTIRIEEIAEHAGEAVRQDARRLSASRPAISDFARRDRRRTAGRAVAAVTVATVAAATIGLVARGQIVPTIEVDRPVGTPPASPDDPSEPPVGDVGQGAAPLPAGWTPASGQLDGVDGEIVPATPGSSPSVFAAGTDLVVEAADNGWDIHRDALPAAPAVLAVGEHDGSTAVLSLTAERAALLGRNGEVIPVEDMPAGLQDGAIGATWRGDVFVVIGRAPGPETPSPAFLLDPDTGSWQQIDGVPLAVNREWNTAMVSTATATGAPVAVTGAWLSSNNSPARPTLGAAVLDPEDNEWRLVEGGTLSPQSADAVPFGDRVLVVDYEQRYAWLTPAGWTTSEPTGMPAGECGPELSVRGDIVLAVVCQQAATFDGESWTRIPVPRPDEDISVGRAVPAPDGFLVPRVRVTTSGSHPVDLVMLDPRDVWPLAPGLAGLVAIPPGWSTAESSLTPNLTSPRERLTASTAPMPAGGDRCAQVPEAAMENLGPGDALVSLQHLSGRPEPGAPHLGGIATLQEEWKETTVIDCPSNSDRLVAYWTAVRHGGASYYLLLVHHVETADEVVDQALAVANSFVPA